MMRTESSMKAKLLLTVFATVFSLVVGEIFLWIVHRLPDPYLQRQTSHPYLPTWIGVKGENRVVDTRGLHGVPYPQVTFRRNSFSYTDDREDLALHPKSPDEFRIVCIGGSTTECFALERRESWPAVLQTLLQKQLGEKKHVSCVNLGVCNTPLRTYLATLAYYGIHLQPDVVIFYVGLNDLGFGVKFPEDPAFEVPYDPFARDKLSLSPAWQYQLLSRTQLGRHLRSLLKRDNPGSHRPGDPRYFADYVPDPASFKEVDLSFTMDPVAAREYSTNLRSAAGICQANRCQMLVLTAPALWRTDRMTDEEMKQLWLRPARGARVASAATCRRLLNARNDLTRTICRESSIPWMDLATMVPSSLEFFYDDVHLNVAGARLVASKVAQELTSPRFAGSLPQPSTPIDRHPASSDGGTK
jgi:lysophospholipase L1-like esterase